MMFAYVKYLMEAFGVRHELLLRSAVVKKVSPAMFPK